jgi:hypothetical protein
MSNEHKQADDRLHELFAAKFGDDWRRDIRLTLRADVLYWLVHLARFGISAKSKLFTDLGVNNAEAEASVASWKIGLDDLLSQVELILNEKG